MDKNKDSGIFIKKVLASYRKNGRHDLVWRKSITPYKILVSEIMLQQTQVGRVLPKFTAWMKKYPTLLALKKASLKDVLILWQGLGYQRRAKALHDISKSVERLPTSFESLKELSGVGTYTASALCAFAYNSFAHPLLETNIRTALIENFYKDMKVVDDKDLYLKLLELENNNIVQKVGAREWYYALMDYGAHLKESNISHNNRARNHVKQTPYKGSNRELRARILFTITHGKNIPKDRRTKELLHSLIVEEFLLKKGGKYIIRESL